MTPRMAAGGRVDLKLGHYARDGIEVVGVGGEIDIYTAPRLRELLIDLPGTNSYQLVVNLGKAGFPGSAGLGVLAGGLNRVRAHDGSLDLVCTRERILKIFKITGLTKVFGICQTVDQAIAARGRPARNLSPRAGQPGASGLSAGAVIPELAGAFSGAAASGGLPRIHVHNDLLLELLVRQGDAVLR